MNNSYDVIIVGTGAAGLYAALTLPNDYNILMITKDSLINSDSYLAQGGISTLLNENDYDSYFEDTLKAGHYKNDKESVRVMIQKSNQIIENLIKYGVKFDLKNGEYDYTREGGHSANRILHKNDSTGEEIVTKLIVNAKKRDNINILEYATMTDIIQEDNVCYGIYLKYKEESIQPIFANYVILATGGLGGLFKNSTNFSHISGDSFAIAIKNNIELENINYIQIHPTALYSKKHGRRLLISESVRGEGAVLLNEKKERFVNELLPRDVVVEAIFAEMKKYHVDHVYLRLENMTSEQAKKRFPKIYEYCLEEGYVLGKDDIPVTPAQHYLMGGIKTNQKGETSMKHLYAVGETACNGVHGKNRLASNSLLESLVFSQEAANAIVHSDKTRIENDTVIKHQLPITDIETTDYNKIVLDEIKRKDIDFYDKWCNDED
ncbi:L-aspartate oxidase [Anaerosacchariphilus polymeriproducens]|uniref:L-aspartate oxidase n=1 Tax=Anaerosacchariphilus polymeriproducens TaxID=1812858 RepID=A0A371AWS3_9FIRM|nr:L-aspartate oxidase [Anaerosacchariphilus polymeriproducens]RDU24036.1 L-aspartate oxidase [Anaerosacchariphilus polymeriproducens]